MKVHFQYEVEFEGDSHLVDFSADFERDGIGAYEFWGQKCFDKGSVQLENIEFSEKNLPKNLVEYLNEGLKHFYETEDPEIKQIVFEAEAALSAASSIGVDKD